jgi:hypothetical protein
LNVERSLTEATARRLFRKTLLSLANFEAAVRPTGHDR